MAPHQQRFDQRHQDLLRLSRMRGYYGKQTTVGAIPALGAGAVSALALIFVVLGPLLGTAATVAVLRGDPPDKKS